MKRLFLILVFLIATVALVGASDVGDDMVYTGSHAVSGTATLSGTNTLSGTTTISGANTVSGATTQSGLVTESGGSIQSSQVHTATDTLTTDDCGKVHFLSHATTAIILTLPAPTAGCEMTFMTTLAFSDQHEIRTPAATNIIHGVMSINNAEILCSGEDSLEFADTVEVVGDYVSITSDGTSWFINGSEAATAAAIACTT